MKRSLLPKLTHEKQLWSRGFLNLAGVDESGRGAWAGPLVAAAVILDKDNARIYNVRDSKLVSEKNRNILAKRIKERAIDFAYGIVTCEEIDEMGLQRANLTVLERALMALKKPFDFVLIDAFKLQLTTPSCSIIKGDRVSVCIAMASILAKVKRDVLMKKYAKKYPMYYFADHVGYGTVKHQEAIRDYGILPIHRKSFRPINDPSLLEMYRGKRQH